MQEAKDLNPQSSGGDLKTPAIPDKEGQSESNSPENDVEAQKSSLQKGSEESDHDKSFPQKLKKFVKECFSAYGAAFIGTGTLMPVFISITTLLFYFTPTIPFLPLLNPEWYSLTYGLLSLFIMWPLTSLCFAYFATAQGVNPHSYGILYDRYVKLNANITSMQKFRFEVEECVVFERARMQCEELKTTFISYPYGIKWITGYGYISAWQLLHSAEEALILIEPLTLVISDVMHDFQSIQDSALNNREELLKRLKTGISDLSPHMKRYLSEVDRSNTGVPGHNTDEPSEGQSLSEIPNESKRETDPVKMASPNASWYEISKEKVARAMLYSIRRELNKFRDMSWLGIMKQRNQLAQTIFLTGIVTYFLLCLSLVTNIHRDVLISATVFYSVAALVGLFDRFYRESQVESKIMSVDDYGLSMARLIAVPLLSGLAGIGGVLVTMGLIALAGKQDATLESVFATDLRNLLIAAIFGLTPNLLIKNLQQSAEKFASNLQKKT